MMRSFLAFAVVLFGVVTVEAFVSLHNTFRPVRACSIVSLAAAGGKKKRRRKQPPSTATQSKQSSPKEVVAPVPIEAVIAKEQMKIADSTSEEEVDKTVIADVASFQFEPDDALIRGK